tara:strand:- start:589 stop:1236 length:648 start_codon:yes stop_codon:yes gene_type:complete
MESKECTKCKVDKPLDQYSKDKNRPGGKLSGCKACYKKYFDAYRKKNKKELNQKSRDWHQSPYGKQKALEWRSLPESKKRTKEYYQENKEHLNHIQWKRIRERLDTEPLFRFQINVRSNIKQAWDRALKGSVIKESKSLDILGCSIEFFVSYISDQFTEGMTLDNCGEWHLDHIIPISTAKTEEDVVRLCHYSNYQPLWAADNLSKGAKLNWKKT